MPSFIDMHAHFRYPGQSQKETLETGLRAAAAGGYGTVVLMPNTVPPVSDADTARRIQDEAAAYGLADVIQSLCITDDQAGNSVSRLDFAGGFPLITEDGRDVDNAALLLEAMKKAAAKNIITACHCEDRSLSLAAKEHRAAALALVKEAGGLYGEIAANRTADQAGNATTADHATAADRTADQANHAGNADTADHAGNATAADRTADQAGNAEFEKANGLLALAEDIACERNIAIAEAASAGNARCRIHICHVSTKRSLDAVVNARRRKQCGVTCEVTPHHIALSSDDPGGLRAIVNPPLRARTDTAALVQGIVSGAVDVIATDHAPHTAADKENGAPGFPGLETAFAVCNTVLVQSGLIPLRRLSALMSANPARILGIADGKGLLKPGFAADFILADPAKTLTVDARTFHTKGAYSPFAGKKYTGAVISVYKNGTKLF
jgi:dihydroorotase